MCNYTSLGSADYLVSLYQRWIIVIVTGPIKMVHCAVGFQLWRHRQPCSRCASWLGHGKHPAKFGSGRLYSLSECLFYENLYNVALAICMNVKSCPVSYRIGVLNSINMGGVELIKDMSGCWCCEARSSSEWQCVTVVPWQTNTQNQRFLLISSWWK